MNDLRYLKAVKFILLSGMGYFSLLPILPTVSNVDYFFAKPTYKLYRIRSVDQMQRAKRHAARITVPSYELLAKMTVADTRTLDPAATEKPPVESVQPEKNESSFSEGPSSSGSVKDKRLPSESIILSPPSDLRLGP